MTQTPEVAEERMEITDPTTRDLFEGFEMDIRSDDSSSLLIRVLRSEARKELRRGGAEVIPLIEKRIAELKAMHKEELHGEVIEAWEMVHEWMT